MVKKEGKPGFPKGILILILRASVPICGYQNAKQHSSIKDDLYSGQGMHASDRPEPLFSARMAHEREERLSQLRRAHRYSAGCHDGQFGKPIQLIQSSPVESMQRLTNRSPFMQCRFQSRHWDQSKEMSGHISLALCQKLFPSSI